MRRALLRAIILTMVAAPAAAQSTGYPLKKCDDPKVAIGILPKGLGVVSYVLSKDGRPDTTTIAVIRVIGLSAAGFKSVAARQLTGCRFDTGSGMSGPRTTVQSDLTFSDSSAIEVSAATMPTTTAAPLPLEPQRIAKDAFPLPIDDPRLEERPRRLGCTPVSGGQRLDGATPLTPGGPMQPGVSGKTQAQKKLASAQASQPLSAATLIARVVVGIDGRPGEQVRVISVTDPAAAQSLAQQISGCRFTPGRVRGAMVPAYTDTRIP